MQRYLTLLLGTILITLTGIIMLNRIANPFAIFATPVIVGFNSHKPEADTRQRLSKAYQVKNLRPDALLLGTSRALRLDPNHPHWQGLNGFNLALTSSSLYEQYRYLQHAQAQTPLREVVLGLDYFMFNHNTGMQFSERRLDVAADGTPQPKLLGIDLHDLLPALLSRDALSSSLVTLHDQNAPLPDDPDYLRQRIANKGGHHALFNELEHGLMSEWSRTDAAQNYGEIGTITEAGSFRQILRLAHRGNIRLYLFISPSHARLWECWRLLGQLPSIEQWKRDMVRANDEEARLAGAAPFPLWDFSGYNSITTEALPEAGDRKTMMYGYFEDSHYSHAVGRLILDRLFDYQTPGHIPPADFGVQLSGENINTHLGELARQGERYRRDHPGGIAELERLYQQATRSIRH